MMKIELVRYDERKTFQVELLFWIYIERKLGCETEQSLCHVQKKKVKGFDSVSKRKRKKSKPAVVLEF